MTATELRKLLAGSDPVRIAPRLLGCELISVVGGVETSGWITEVEAYFAPADRASHAYANRRTARTEVFFGPPGISYVYLCYGIHDMMNVVTGPAGTPHAVRIRAIEPNRGLEHIMERRHSNTLKPQLGAGPGVVCKALGIRHKEHNGIDLLDGGVLRLRPGRGHPPDQITVTPRIGIDGAGPEWAAKPWRFYVRDNRFVSRLNAFKE